MNILYKSFSSARGDELVWRLDSRRLRILCYHGICEDRLADQPWIPPEFVAQSAFEKQLRYLQNNATVLPLAESVTRLRNGSLPSRSVSITFDDGYANNLHFAYPLLRKYQTTATIFLTSAYVKSGELFPFVKRRLIRLGTQISASLTGDQHRMLRPLTIEEVQDADRALIEFGAHSHTHCILGNETFERRQEEIRTSIANVTQWTGRPVQLFSYPNGQRGDFGEVDKEVLRGEGIRAAVSGIRGANNSHAELLELKRYPIGLYHDDEDFKAEVTGFRGVLLAASWRSLS